MHFCRPKSFFLAVLIFSGSALLCRQFMGGSSSSSMTQPAVVQPKEKATASLIFLHGLGDTGHGWADLFKELSLKNIRCICPHAPSKPVTLNAGMVMPSWFDIKGLTPNSPEDEAGIKSAAKDLQSLIAKEVSSGIPSERVFIGGFSQGGAVALYSAFASSTKIGGAVILSSWLPLNKHFTNDGTTKHNTDIPVFQGHGQSDPIVPYLWGQATSSILQKFNPNTQFKSYAGMGHSSCPQEMNDLKVFLEEKLPVQES